MKREELEAIQIRACGDDGFMYEKEDADSVMDDLEAQVKNLEKANAELIKRVQELEDECNKLEAENEQLKDKK